MPNPFRLGFLTHLRGGGDPRQVYQDALTIFDAADQLGFDVGWVAQHHFKDEAGLLPSPFPFLAAVAARTKRLRLGISIIVLPLEHPLRVAEDAAVVDTLSGGRLELGVGSGSDPAEFAAFQVDMDQRHQRTTAGLIALRQALAGEALGDSGQRLQPAVPTLGSRLWLSGLSVRGAQYAAENAAGLLLSRAAWASEEPTDHVQEPVAKAFCAAWSGQPGRPRIGLSRGIYIGTSREAALSEIEGDLHAARDGMVRQGRLPDGISLPRFCQRLHLAYGSPQEVAAQLQADRVLPYATDLILQFDPIHPSPERTIHMLEQIATEVAPALGWQPSGGL